MAHYFLHLEDQDGLYQDGVGFEASDLMAAWDVLRRTAGDLVADDLASGIIVSSFHLCLDDESGKRVLTVPVKCAIGPSTT